MNTDNQTTSQFTSYLITLGEEFEKFSGMRPLAMAANMDEADPIDDMGWYTDSFFMRLEKGVTDAEQLFPLCEACYFLHVEYGQDVWVGQALFEYFHGVKGLNAPEARAKRDFLLAQATGRYDEMRKRNEERSRIYEAKRLLSTLAEIDGLAEDMKKRLEALRGAMRVLNMEVAA